MLVRAATLLVLLACGGPAGAQAPGGAQTPAPVPGPTPTPAPAAGVERGRLRGQVRAPGLKPVPGATAAAVRAEAPPLLAVTATDAQGFLSMDGVPQGTWKLVVFAPGFVPGAVDGLAVGGPFRAVADMTLRPGEAPPSALVLPASAGADDAGLRVITVAERTPLAGVRLRLDPLGHRADPLVAETAENGEARLPAIGAGHWRVSIGRAGWTRLVVPDVEVKGGPLTILARLLPTPEGTPVPVEELLPPPRLID